MDDGRVNFCDKILHVFTDRMLHELVKKRSTGKQKINAAECCLSALTIMLDVALKINAAFQHSKRTLNHRV